MEDDQVIPNSNVEDVTQEEPTEEVQDIKIKKWEHIAIRPETFTEFRRQRGEAFKSDDAFVKALLKSRENTSNV